nr:dienelactone hydrolase family protein [Chitinophaga niastensis]
MFLDSRRDTALPTPSGPFAVGRTSFVWKDSTKVDSMATKPGTKRELIAWIWYPALPQQPSPSFAAYLPLAWRKAVEHQRGMLINKMLTRDLSRVRTHSIPDADLSPEKNHYPVIILRAGLAALVTGYTSIAEDLASNGYVVVGFDAPYRSAVSVFPDGRVVEISSKNNADMYSGSQQKQLAEKLVKAWSADMRYALDQLQHLNGSDSSGKFRGRLDMERVGVVGHSLGGATALQFCYDDSRCKAGIDVDGAPQGEVINDSITQPFMFLTSEHSSDPDSVTSQVIANIRLVYNRQSTDRRSWLMIHGASHFRFSDDGALLKIPMIMSVLHSLGIIHLDGRRQMAITTYCINHFFDTYLKDSTGATLEIQRKFPEIEYSH